MARCTVWRRGKGPNYVKEYPLYLPVGLTHKSAGPTRSAARTPPGDERTTEALWSTCAHHRADEKAGPVNRTLGLTIAVTGTGRAPAWNAGPTKPRPGPGQGVNDLVESSSRTTLTLPSP
jgi:hypothetical protein